MTVAAEPASDSENKKGATDAAPFLSIADDP